MSEISDARSSSNKYMETSGYIHSSKYSWRCLCRRANGQVEEDEQEIDEDADDELTDSRPSNSPGPASVSASSGPLPDAGRCRGRTMAKTESRRRQRTKCRGWTLDVKPPDKICAVEGLFKADILMTNALRETRSSTGGHLAQSEKSDVQRLPAEHRFKCAKVVPTKEWVMIWYTRSHSTEAERCARDLRQPARVSVWPRASIMSLFLFGARHWQTQVGLISAFERQMLAEQSPIWELVVNKKNTDMIISSHPIDPPDASCAALFSVSLYAASLPDRSRTLALKDYSERVQNLADQLTRRHEAREGVQHSAQTNIVDASCIVDASVRATRAGVSRRLRVHVRNFCSFEVPSLTLHVQVDTLSLRLLSFSFSLSSALASYVGRASLPVH
ncbi:hypothetical protein DFH11DRAFT_1550772 [Phellopilus nigrolimitatus]|nr:hypothetical protein DFH11DRAFT_1550772 [Phellopilus nigrolimitatus]